MASNKRAESVNDNEGEEEEAVPKRRKFSDAAQAAASKKRAESVNVNGGEEEEAVRKRWRFSDAVQPVKAAVAAVAARKAEAEEAVERVHSVVMAEAGMLIAKPAAPAAEKEMDMLLQELAAKVIKEAEGSEQMARFTSLADITDPGRKFDPQWPMFSAAKKVADAWAAEVTAVGLKVSNLMAAAEAKSEADALMVALKPVEAEVEGAKLRAAKMMNSIYADVAIYLFLRGMAESAGIVGDNNVSFENNFNPSTSVSQNRNPLQEFFRTRDPNDYNHYAISSTNSGDSAADTSMVGETSNC